MCLGSFRSSCREQLDSDPRDVVAFYANPKFPPKLLPEFDHLEALDTEMRHLLRTTNPFDIYIQPAVQYSDIRDTLHKYNPRIVVWSGHTFGGHIVLTNDNNIPQPIDASELCTLLENAPRLQLVVLMGCHTEKVCRRVSDTLNIPTIGWSTKVEDKPAYVFSKAMFNSMQTEIKKSEISAQHIFNKALRGFKNEFVVGDPFAKCKDWDFKTRGQCPPDTSRHGIPVLIDPGKAGRPALAELGSNSTKRLRTGTPLNAPPSVERSSVRRSGDCYAKRTTLER